MEPEDDRQRKGRNDPFDDPFFRGFPSSLFSNFTREFERMQQEMEDLMKGALAQQARGQKPGEPFVYGFSMKVGPDGKPNLQHFGNVGPARAGGPADGREPLTDVIEGGQDISVTCELPGISKEDVNLHVSDDRITIRVDTPRKYYKVIPLPTPVVPKSAKATFKNGVLDLTIARRQERRDPGERVSID